MHKARVEAFSDGVMAIIITIMVLELRPPHGDSIASLVPLLPHFSSYLLSFIFLGIYWNNHHHLMQAVVSVNGRVLWANLNLLFWLSLIPFVTAWMGENSESQWPVAIYGLALLCSGIAYFILVRVLVWHHGKESLLANAMGNDFKGIISVVLYSIGIPLAFFKVGLAYACYVLVALLWLYPDRRIEKILTSRKI